MGLIKHSLANSQAGNIGEVTRLGEFWEEESQTQLPLKHRGSKMRMLHERYQAICLNKDKN